MRRLKEKEYTYGNIRVCPKKHYTLYDFNEPPSAEDAYCDECGLETMTKCLHCGVKIKGSKYIVEKYSVLRNFMTGERSNQTFYKKDDSPYKLPSHCSNCGNMFPWTELVLKEIEDILDMSEELDEVDRAIIKSNFPNLIIDAPGSTVSALKVKKALALLDKSTRAVIEKVGVNIVTDEVRKLLEWVSR